MHRVNQILLAASALLLTSCGPGQVAGIEGTGAPAPVTATGPVTGFGSIFVNGVEFTTTGAQIQIDDQPGTESQLAIGEVVTVTGTLNANNTSGTAAQVTFLGNVLGPVAQVDVATNTFVVLGQTVLVTANTVFDPNIQPPQISSVKTGSRYEVSGFPDSSGQIVASRIQLATTGTALRVTGAVQGLNTGTTVFQINALSVDYSTATVHGTLADGSTVDVEGGGLNASGALSATTVTVLPPPGGAPNSRGEVEGVITSFNSVSDFVVNGIHVATNANTLFQLNGITLGVNVRVDVEGSYDSSGILVATSVEAGDE
ncbi:MAG TPA: DUF5666 domain-containing protein [Steroidobacteraceae bacterium]|nr:DUF5666 domain-containing protein [Steroidobacteraceae bacterium]